MIPNKGWPSTLVFGYPSNQENIPKESVDMVFLQTNGKNLCISISSTTNLPHWIDCCGILLQRYQGMSKNQSSQWGQMDIQTWIKKGLEILEHGTPK